MGARAPVVGGPPRPAGTATFLVGVDMSELRWAVAAALLGTAELLTVLADRALGLGETNESEG